MIKKICVCSVQVPFVRGGAEYFTENLIAQLLERSFEVDHVQLPFQTIPLEEVVKGCLAWRLLNLDRIYNDEIDLVIATKFPSYMVPHPRKIIWLVHQHREIYDLYGTIYSGFRPDNNDSRLREKIIELDEMALQEAQGIFAISKTVAGRLKKFHQMNSEVIYPPLDDAGKFFFDSMEDFVLSVSRLEGNKRVDLLIDAMQYVSPHVKALIIGEGFLRNDYERRAQALGLSDRIRFEPRVSRSDLIGYYSRAGALFYGAIGEDFGYATIEAFSARKPVITCNDSGGILEFVDDQSGWVSDPNPQAIAQNIEQSMAQKSLSAEKGAAGYKRVQFITWDYVIDRLLAGKTE